MTDPQYLRELLRANLFDGYEGGTVTMPVAQLLTDIVDILAEAEAAHPAPLDEPHYGPCAGRFDNQPTPSARPWRYDHAASIEGAHWNIYAGEGIEGWLVGMVTTEADAALIVAAVNAQPARLDELPWRAIGYTAEECERDTRRWSDGKRGCANPDEHLMARNTHMSAQPAPLDEDRLARALHGENYVGWTDHAYREMAGRIARAYREDSDD